MRIFGIDFTSVPRQAKPITCAVCSLYGERLTLEGISSWGSFTGFEEFLAREGPWTAAIDFPFGQPQRLTRALGWPDDWSEFVKLIGKMTMQEFTDVIKQYRDQQPAGDKHHLRTTDKLAESCSPMMLYGVPVGKMFFEGAPRLCQAEVSVWPCRIRDPQRVVVEGYPALVVRNLLGKLKYKNEKANTVELAPARETIVDRLQANEVYALYGVSLRSSSGIWQQLIADAKGDKIDALMCALQAAYFTLLTQKCDDFPSCAHATEGWITDPSCMKLE